jgi:PAS domain S-box-containing protein
MPDAGLPDRGSGLTGFDTIHRTLHSLSTAPSIRAGDLDEALPLIATTACGLFRVSRASVWLLDREDPDRLIVCSALSEEGGTASGGQVLEAPAYIRLLRSERVIVSDNSLSDPRFAEFHSGYFTEHGVVSTLDAPVLIGDRVFGVICIEHTSSSAREWALHEQVIASSIAGIIAQAVESDMMRRTSAELDRARLEKEKILEGVEDVVVHLGSDGRVIWGNTAAARALRVPVLQPGTDWAGIWSRADLPPDVMEMVLRMEDGELHGTEIPYPDRRYRFTTVSSLGSSSGGASGYVLFAHDTTEHRYSTILHDTTRRLIETGMKAASMGQVYSGIHSIIAEVVEADNFYIALYDPERDLITFPYYVDRFDDSPPPRKPGRGFTELVLREGRPLALSESEMADLITTGQVDLIGRLASWWLGVPLLVEDRTFGVMAVQSYSEGAPLEQRQRDALLTLSGAAALVIEKRRSEDALGDSEARYRAVAENAQDGIVLVSGMRILYANGTMAKMIGVSWEELIGKPFTDFIAPADRSAIARRNADRLAGREVPSIYETALVCRDGSEIPVEFNISMITGADDPEVLAIVRDISDRKRLEQERRLLERQIQHSQKLESLGVLAGGIAHDFNNLLMGILGNAGLALMELPKESPVRRTIERLETAALRAAELTNQLLAYSGRGKFIVEPVNLNVLVEEMINLLNAAVPKNTVLRLDLAHEPPVVEGDSTQLRQVLMNLVMNASEAIGDRSGIITVSTGLTTVDRAYLSGTYLDEDLGEGVYTYIEVSDTGCGMDEKTRLKIFDPFFTTKFTGRGLGLAAVLGIVRGHHGTLKVYSEPDRGSSFKILLPSIGEHTGERPGPFPGLDAVSCDTTILVVDDEETVRTVARLSLEKCGFKVLTAVDGADAMEHFRRDPSAVDLVLLDMTMPHMNGEETFRELRRIRQDVKVILSSGYNEMDAAGRFAGKGLAGFIQKPYRPVDLINKVKTALGVDRAGSKTCPPPDGREG